ncbi:MAG TPA: S41 family peptidase [Candidatus Paceibacterota bacterium]
MNIYTSFVLQAYDRITTDYWQSSAEYQASNFGGLPALFQETLQKVTGVAYPLSSRADLVRALDIIFANTTDADVSEKRAATIVATAVDNMWPHTVPNRNALTIDQTEQVFQNTVNNQHPERDRYAALGLREADKKSYTRMDIDTALAQKQKELAASTSVAAVRQLQEAKNAYTILSDTNSKARYDVAKAEPTLSWKIISDVLYIKISQNASQTAHEFTEAIDAAIRRHPGLTSIILDLRGNLGGYDTVTSEIVGDFAGSSTPFYAVKVNGGIQQFVTSTDTLPMLRTFRSRVILIDGNTKSTGELMSQALRRSGSFILVGTTTGGWGTIENGKVFPLGSSFVSGNQYFLRLVIGATLTDSFQLVEGLGIRPDIDVSTQSWRADLKRNFPGSSLPGVVSSLF